MTEQPGSPHRPEPGRDPLPSGQAFAEGVEPRPQPGRQRPKWPLIAASAVSAVVVLGLVFTAGVMLAGGSSSSAVPVATLDVTTSGATTTRTLSPAATTIAPAPTIATTTPAATTAAPTTAANAVLGLGKERAATGIDGVRSRVTVFAVNQNAAPAVPRPQSGGHWVSVDAQFCLDGAPTGQGVSLSWSPWTVQDEAHGRYPGSSVTYSGMPVPQYPNSDDRVAVGECMRGSLVFPVTDGVKVTTVRYAARGVDPVQWTVK